VAASSIPGLCSHKQVSSQLRVRKLLTSLMSLEEALSGGLSRAGRSSQLVSKPVVEGPTKQSPIRRIKLPDRGESRLMEDCFVPRSDTYKQEIASGRTASRSHNVPVRGVQLRSIPVGLLANSIT
jgi:hypothetical protein